MKSLRFGLFVMMVVGGLAFVRPAFVSYAAPTVGPPPPPSAAAACYFLGFSCTTGGTCTCGTGPLSNATVNSVSAKETPSGTENLDCTGDLPPSAAPPHAVICRGPANGVCTLRGFPGQAGNGAVSGHTFATTADWQEVISPSGQISLHCHNLEPFGR
jgi:hypothetical protein